MVIAHNMLAMNNNRQLKIIGGDKTDSIWKLSSGYQINNAKDDAAGLSISEKMRFQLRGLDRGADNIMEGISYCQVADGALQEIEDMCQRMNQLAVQAANGTNSETDRSYLDEEMQQLKTEIDRICVTTKYNDSYIFQCEDKIEEPWELYKLDFSGIPTDVKIYNTSYDDATGQATYGGIIYQGTRFSWDEIDPYMYDATANQFRAGNYTLNAPDGTVLNFHCEDGTQPPEVFRDFSMTAGKKGITINGTDIPWSMVSGGSKGKLDQGYVEATPYSFLYNGVTISFTPDEDDDLDDVIRKLSGTRWRSSYIPPVQEKSVEADFNNCKGYITDNQAIADFITNGSWDYSYILHADENEIWLTEQNSTTRLGVLTWADLGLADWGNLSTDVSENYIYEYLYEPNRQQGISISVTFDLLDETSKDTLIDALDNVEIKADNNIYVSNHSNVALQPGSSSSVVGATVTRDNMRYTVQEEHDLGRDFSVKDDTFGDEQLNYDGTQFQVTFHGTGRDYTYQTNPTSLNTTTNQTVNTIMREMPNYLQTLAERYREGASEPGKISLVSLMGTGSITGGGSETNFTNTVTIDPADPTVKRTSNNSIGVADEYAGVAMDFSGLGTSYNLADLIGTGFNSTCETCNDHYSVQFTTQNLTGVPWQSCVVNGQTYNYYRQASGSNYTLYLDIGSFQGNVADGVAFTNTLVDVIQKSGFAYHFTAYATKTDSAVLYAYDNRPEYVVNGTSKASHAVFSPTSYSFNSMADVNITLNDADTSSRDYMTVKYQYDYSELIQGNLAYQVTPDSNGQYVYDAVTGNYEKYDSSRHNPADRVTIDSIQFSKDAAFVENYVKTTMYSNIANASKIQLQSNDYAYANLHGNEKPNQAMVTRFDTPKQINRLKGGGNTVEERIEYLRIQCSSNTIDNLFIQKAELSVNRLGMRKMSLMTEGQATEAIDIVAEAINKVNKIRSRFGAYQNRLEHAYDITLNTHENTQYAESAIRDTDMAEEMVRFSNISILQQAGQAMLAQANQGNQSIMALVG